MSSSLTSSQFAGAPLKRQNSNPVYISVSRAMPPSQLSRRLSVRSDAVQDIAQAFSELNLSALAEGVSFVAAASKLKSGSTTTSDKLSFFATASEFVQELSDDENEVTEEISSAAKHAFQAAEKLSKDSSLSARLEVLGNGSEFLGEVVHNDKIEADVAAGTEQTFLAASRILMKSDVGRLSSSLLQVAKDSRIPHHRKGLSKIESVENQSKALDVAASAALIAQGSGIVASRLEVVDKNVSSAIKSTGDASKNLGAAFRLQGEIDRAQVALGQMGSTLKYLRYKNLKKIPELGHYKIQGVIADSSATIGNAGIAVGQVIPGIVPFSLASRGLAVGGEISGLEVRAKILKELGDFIDTITPGDSSDASSGVDQANSLDHGYKMQQQEIAIKHLAGVIKDTTGGVLNDTVKLVQTAEAVATNRSDRFLEEKVERDKFIDSKILKLRKKQLEWNTRAIAVMQMLDDVGVPKDTSGISTLVYRIMEKRKISDDEAAQVVEEELQRRILKNDPIYASNRLTRVFTEKDDVEFDDKDTLRSVLNDFAIVTLKPFYIPKDASIDDCLTAAEEIGIPGVNRETSIENVFMAILKTLNVPASANSSVGTSKQIFGGVFELDEDYMESFVL